jgi:hypothetical protein
MSSTQFSEQQPGFFERLAQSLRRVFALGFLALIGATIFVPVAADIAVGAGIVFAGSDAVYTRTKNRRLRS